MPPGQQMLKVNKQIAQLRNLKLTEDTQQWSKQILSSSYAPISSFPSRHVPAGWLRSLVHAHYIFLTDADPDSFVPDLAHGLAVQRLVRETAEHLDKFRKSKAG